MADIRGKLGSQHIYISNSGVLSSIKGISSGPNLFPSSLTQQVFMFFCVNLRPRVLCHQQVITIFTQF
ncbi:hypothetical protein HanPSC8_Chr05g0200891 [Helianthus annuus]|nr:hypothetical protein HanPSC8_Chr05g0200891 [Helianthus annuus]